MNKYLRYVLYIVGGFAFYLLTGDGSEAILLLIILTLFDVLKHKN